MGCACNQSPCNCFQPDLQASACECPDLGVVLRGVNVLVADQKFCSRRLLPPTDSNNNPIAGILSSSPTLGVTFTSAPAVNLPVLTATSGLQFQSIVAAQGTAGNLVQVRPAANGLFVQSSGGQFILGPLPATSVPDPLTIGTINVGTLLNSTAPATLSGVVTLGAGTVAGTIVSLLGINGSGNVVLGSASTVSKAMYYEAASGTDTTVLPNRTTTANGFAVIGNELYDKDSIAHVTNSQTISIDKAGEYEIEWVSSFNNRAFTPVGTASTRPALYLSVNANVVNFGQFQLTADSISSSATVSGIHVQHLNIGDTIQLQAGPNVGTGTLRDVRMVLTKFQ